MQVIWIQQRFRDNLADPGRVRIAENACGMCPRNIGRLCACQRGAYRKRGTRRQAWPLVRHGRAGCTTPPLRPDVYSARLRGASRICRTPRWCTIHDRLGRDRSGQASVATEAVLPSSRAPRCVPRFPTAFAARASSQVLFGSHFRNTRRHPFLTGRSSASCL
jgi:hypothetical protein